MLIRERLELRQCRHRRIRRRHRPGDILARRSGSSLIFKLIDSTDQITVSSFFSDSAYAIEEVCFADGATW
ncbi:MAG: hypothetical protein LBR95_08245, partial [Azoarcus sp.]|nr:hypothetical protein [Azoarcus sp.]